MTDILPRISEALLSSSEARRDETLDAAYVEIERLRAAAAYDKCTIDFLKGDSPSEVRNEEVRKLLGEFYQTIDVMVSAHNSEQNRMCVWARDVKAVQDVMLFLERLRDIPTSAQAVEDPLTRQPDLADASRYSSNEIAQRMWQTFNVTGDRWFKYAAQRLEGTSLPSASRGTEA